MIINKIIKPKELYTHFRGQYGLDSSDYMLNTTQIFEIYIYIHDMYIYIIYTDRGITTIWDIYMKIHICICNIYVWYIYHHHHHVVPLARISLTLSRHFSLSFIASGRSSGLHSVSYLLNSIILIQKEYKTWIFLLYIYIYIYIWWIYIYIYIYIYIIYKIYIYIYIYIYLINIWYIWFIYIYIYIHVCVCVKNILIHIYKIYM